MLKRNKTILSVIAGLLIGAGINTLTSTTALAASNRLWGMDRYETSSAISKSGWQTSDYVVVASGEGYADALCAAPIAKKYNAPILLTESQNLNSKIKQEIIRLKAKHIIIIGKYGSVSQEAENELKAIGEVKRLGGNDRYETSVIVAKELGNINGIVVTSGYGFADALSMAPVAAQKNMPILLTGKDELPSVVKDYINQNKSSIINSYVVGGSGVISDNAAKQSGNSSIRLSGQNRFETNVKIMDYFAKELKFDKLYVVQGDGPTGKEFADALSGTALAVKTSSPVILTYKTIPEVTNSFIKSHVTKESVVTALGGKAAVSDEIISTIEKHVSGDVEKPSNPQVPSGGGAGGGATSTTTSAKDGDIELVFSNNSKVAVNVNSQSNIDISSNFKNNNLLKIKIYSSVARDVELSLNGFGTIKHVSIGWNEFRVPTDFGEPDTGDPGIAQASLDTISSNGQFNLSIKSGTERKTILVKYK